MRTAVAVLVTLFAATGAMAEPRARSVEECAIYADLALVAATLAKHGIPRDTAARMLPDMYEISTGEARELAQRILESAYLPRGVAPKDFSRELVGSCVARGGALDAVLGVRL